VLDRLEGQSLDIDYSLEFLSPFHCGAGEGKGLFDRLVRRDQGLLVVPGSTVKGLTRENYEFLVTRFGITVNGPHLSRDKDERKKYIKSLFSEYDIVYAIFGSPWQPGTVFFDDAVFDDEWSDYFTDAGSEEHKLRMLRGQVDQRSRVRIDRYTGTAERGALFTSEYGKRGLRFNGKIYGSYRYPADKIDYSLPLLLLMSALKIIDSVGAERSTGCGRCHVEIEHLRLNGKPQDVSKLLERLDEELQFLSLAAEEWGV
jgi:CRISPR/Cas system CSM-associated protein Csm3 (group 7 of RAMP superfamily)